MSTRFWYKMRGFCFPLSALADSLSHARTRSAQGQGAPDASFQSNQPQRPTLLGRFKSRAPELSWSGSRPAASGRPSSRLSPGSSSTTRAAMLDQLRERVGLYVDLRGSVQNAHRANPEYAKTVNNAAAGPERPPVKNVSRPLGRRGGDYRVSSLQAEVILTTLTTKTAKRIQLGDGEDHKAMRNRLRSWFRRHHVGRRATARGPPAGWPDSLPHCGLVHGGVLPADDEGGTFGISRSGMTA